MEATRLRFRPILMTAFAFIFGVVPLVIATGPGADMRQSLGTAVFSGMLGVTLFGLFLTPVLFVALRLAGRHRAEAVVERRKDAALGRQTCNILRRSNSRHERLKYVDWP